MANLIAQLLDRARRGISYILKMNVVLCTWNPDKWTISDRQWERETRQIRDCGFLYSQWSVGNSTKLVKPGDVAFLLRQTHERGILAKGTVTSDVFEEGSWEGDDETDNYVDITWTCQLPIDKRLRFEDLATHLPEVNWIRYSSGTTVDPQYHAKLFELWDQTVLNAGMTAGSLPKRVAPPADLIQTQKGFCGLCGLDPAAIYNTTPSSFLVAFTFDTTGEQVAVCPNCYEFASTFPSAKSTSELHQLLSGQF